MAAPLAAGTAALVLAWPPPGGGKPNARPCLPEDALKRLEDRSAPLCDSALKAIDALGAVTDTAPPGPECA